MTLTEELEEKLKQYPGAAGRGAAGATVYKRASLWNLPEVAAFLKKQPENERLFVLVNIKRRDPTLAQKIWEACNEGLALRSCLPASGDHAHPAP